MLAMIKRGIAGTLAAIFVTIFALASPALAGGTNQPNQACDTNSDGSVKVNVIEGVDCAKGDNTQNTLFGQNNEQGLFKTIVNVLLFLIGAVSVIMLIIGGLRYVLSNGDSSQVTNAKNTILYAVIGIVVALLAYAIVNFVITSFASS